MFKRLPVLCTLLIALVGCGGQEDRAAGEQRAPAASTAAAPAATAPMPSAASSGTPAGSASAAPVASAPVAATSAPASAASTPAANAADEGRWVEGRDYFRIEPQQPKVTGTDKIEVVEVFSFGCPACNAYHLTAARLAKSLPSGAVMVYLPASFIPQENWPMLQRAYLTAQALGVPDDKGMDAMYDAVWKTRELTAYKPSGDGLLPQSELPTIEDAAKVYARLGVDPKEFVAVAHSFAINTKMKRADELVKAYGVEGTPTIVIDGKYRFSPMAVGAEQSIALAQWLVAREASGR